MLSRLVLWAINNARFSKEDRALFTGSLLRRFGAVDLGGILTIDGGRVSIRGVPMSQEQTIAVRESALAMETSIARKFVREQVLTEAVNIGFVSAQDMDQVLFARAAVWFGTKEEEWYDRLAQL